MQIKHSDRSVVTSLKAIDDEPRLHGSFMAGVEHQHDLINNIDSLDEAKRNPGCHYC